MEGAFSEDFASAIAQQIGSIESFKPCAYYINGLHEVKVITKDCSYTAQAIIVGGIDIFWENHRPWWKPWKKCVGFSVHCPSHFGFRGEVPVVSILRRVEYELPRAFGKHSDMLYEMATDLTVHIP